MKKILVTGASGFIGRHCLSWLAAGYEVHGLSRRKPTSIGPEKIKWHETDLLTPGSASELVRQIKPDCLLHLAWYTSPRKFWEAPENKDWVRASRELLTAFAEYGGKRAVIAGTCAEYDWEGGECREDSTPLRPASLYGSSKMELHNILASLSGLSFGWARIFYVYGPWEDPSRLVAYVTRSLLQGRPAICSDPHHARDFLHVEDVASALVALLSSSVEGAVNIGSGEQATIGDLLSKIGYYLGRPHLLQFDGGRSAGGPPAFWANTDRLKNEVGWTPRYDLNQGLEQTIEWWRSSMTDMVQP